MSTEIESKKIFVLRCFHAVLLSAGLQFLLLAVFLLFVNFNIFHPIKWIAETISLVLSFYTWFCIMPLISVTITYSLLLGNSYLAVRKYYSTRISWIYGTGLRKISFLGIYIMIGFLTAWLYSRFLKDDYKSIIVECFEGNCLNLRFMFLALAGVYSGIYFFFKERLTTEPEIQFPLINESKYVKIRSTLYSTLYSCLLKSFTPTLCYMVLFWLFGITFSEKIANIFDVKSNGDLHSLYSIITSIRLIFYAWILSSQILCNMYLTDTFFNILITEPIEFEIERNAMIQNCSGITLVEALSLTKLPVAQHLASLDLYNVAVSNSSDRRGKIFSLSIPGGHPYNWNHLSSQCLVLINGLCEEISETVKNLNPNQMHVELPKRGKPTASDVAEQILRRQYNESVLIKNRISSNARSSQSCITSTGTIVLDTDPCGKINDYVNNIIQSFRDVCWTTFQTIPGLYYLFGEQKDSKLTHILSQSKYIIWITQALAGLCEKSLTEDKYGVIQIELPQIIKSLLNLKITLDKLNTLNFSGKKVDRNFIALKNAVKRSLYHISTVFADYMPSLIDNPDDLRLIMCFVNYQEV